MKNYEIYLLQGYFKHQPDIRINETVSIDQSLIYFIISTLL